MSFIAPLFLLGAGLLAVPWIIHQIRRPEREVVKFSSLMFVPNVPKEVIERRRIQHILLMLARMALLLLLAFAFARPFWSVLAVERSAEGPGRHLILLDTSYSMGTAGWFDEAKRRAKNIVRQLPGTDDVAVAAFAERPTVLAPFSSDSDPRAGTASRAIEAIDAARLSQSATAYLPALLLAQDILLPEPEEEPSARAILHVVSDFQKGGMPEQSGGWKLSKLIEFRPVLIGEETPPNYAILDLGMRQTQSNELRIQAKVKNWTDDTSRPVRVQLNVEGEVVGAKTIDVKKGNATAATFQIPLPARRSVEGWVELASDALAAENRRYFVWNPPRRMTALVVADEQDDEDWPSAWFVEHAFSETVESPWELEPLAQNELPGRLQEPNRPEVVLLADLRGLRADTASAVTSYVEEGGSVLLMLNQTINADVLSDTLLQPFQLRSLGLRYTRTRPEQYSQLAWVDFDHPTFELFQGARFNDFSSIRAYNYHRLERTGVADDHPASVIARMSPTEDGVEWPAMVEARLGDGKLILWTAGLDVEWSNLVKSSRFVPLLYETLAYLTDLEAEQAAWTVGQVAQGPKPISRENTSVQLPGTDQVDQLDGEATTAETLRLTQSGFLRWRDDDANEWVRVDAVNVDGNESDPERIDPAEFELKLCAAPELYRAGEETERQTEQAADEGTRREWGRGLLVALFALLLMEGWYASRLSR